MFKFDKNLMFYKAPPLLFAALIIVISTSAGTAPPSLGVAWSDKIYHFAEYFLLGLLVFRALPEIRQSPQKRILYGLLFLIGIIYAAVDERIQYYIPNRDSSPYDWAADAAGYVVAGLLFLLCKARRSVAKKQLTE